jgi:hypothetical protein
VYLESGGLRTEESRFLAVYERAHAQATAAGRPIHIAHRPGSKSSEQVGRSGWLQNLEYHLFRLEVIERVVCSQEHKRAKLRVIKLTSTMKPLRLSERNCPRSNLS